MVIPNMLYELMATMDDYTALGKVCSAYARNSTEELSPIEASLIKSLIKETEISAERRDKNAAKCKRYRDRIKSESGTAQPLATPTDTVSRGVDDGRVVSTPCDTIKDENKDEKERSKEKEETKEETKESLKRKVFVKPTVEEVRSLIVSRGYHFDAESFVSFYESKGWKVGNSPMKNWQAACVTWERARKGNTSNQYQKPMNAMALNTEGRCHSDIDF